MAVASVGIMDLPAVLEHQQAEVAVLDDRVARPSADRDQRGAPHQAHGAMHDDGICLIALDHADIEEAGIFAVHGVMHDGALAVAMILRRLDHPDLRVGEGRHQILEPVGPHHVIGVDDRDDLGVGSRMCERKAQRAGLVACDVILVDELETLAQRAAMVLDRTPKRGIRRIIDDDDAFEIRVIEPRDRVERGLEHVRRLAIGRHVDRNLGRKAVGRGQGGVDQPPRTTPESDDGNLFDARERDYDQRGEQHDTEPERDGCSQHEIMSLPEGKDGGAPGADHIGCHRQRRGLAECGGASCQDGQRQQQAEQHRDRADLPVVGIAHHSCPGELGLARGIEHTPIHAHAAFIGLPRLVEGFHDVVVDAVCFGPGNELAQHARLLDASGIGLEHVVARAGPAELGDHDALARMRLPQLGVELDGFVDSLGCRESVPVGEDVGGDEVDR